MVSSCGDSSKKSKQKKESKTSETVKIVIPDFNQDSAYIFVENQVKFGPRVPGTKANLDCAQYLTNTLKRFTPHVQIQDFKARVYNGNIITGQNIIATFKPEAKNRILLCAHWDSRPYADHDLDINNANTPIDGANDGASGVGVLLEIARQLNKSQPKAGIDIILFDLEDYGEPQGVQSKLEDNWALGSQYWAKNPHKINYKARFGILLDMVGASDALFTQEGTSMYFAPHIMRKIWNKAEEIGYGDYFSTEETGAILDDHHYVNLILGIPTIDIIHYDPTTKTGFFKYWHTINDNIDVIDPVTLKVVGQTVLAVIFE
ncbi:MAG: M28 family peptidase [Bacteroidales bacterium]|nr:M28 family peptidase [Bacteroidales bacterium]